LVVMPAYNSAATIAGAIQSILDQKNVTPRLHIVDDYSNDNTYEIAKQYERYQRVKVFRNSENRGAYYSRNAGLYYGRNYTWDYYTTHDADDISHQHRYATLIRALQKPQVTAAQDRFMRISWPDGHELGDQLTMAHAVFKKSVFSYLGYFHENRFGADWEYWHRLTTRNRLTGQRTYASQHVLGTSLIHGQNLTSLIPIGSPARRNYIKQIRLEVAAMAKQDKFYRHVDGKQIERITTR
jgi:glycosyltransferase involved in cell wall biosynthesis